MTIAIDKDEILFDLKTMPTVDYSAIEDRIMAMDLNKLSIDGELTAFYKQTKEALHAEVTASTEGYEDKTKKELIELLKFRDETIEDYEAEIKEMESDNNKLADQCISLKNQQENGRGNCDPYSAIYTLAKSMRMDERTLEKILKQIMEDNNRRGYGYPAMDYRVDAPITFKGF